MKVICPTCKKELSHTAIYRHTRRFHSDVKKITITIERRSHTELNRDLSGQNRVSLPLDHDSNFKKRD